MDFPDSSRPYGTLDGILPAVVPATTLLRTVPALGYNQMPLRGKVAATKRQDVCNNDGTRPRRAD